VICAVNASCFTEAKTSDMAIMLAIYVFEKYFEFSGGSNFILPILFILF